VLPLGLADKLVMAVEVPELLPMDGHLIGNPNRTATGVLSAGLSSKDFSAGGWRTSSRPRDPALFSISPSLSLSNSSAAAFAPARGRSSKPAGDAILLREDPILTQFLAMRTRVRRSPRLWMEESFLRERRARRTISRRRTAPICPESKPPTK
jgi:hypothetical protein